MNVRLLKLKVDPIRRRLALKDRVITTTMLLEILLVVNTIFLTVSIYTLRVSIYTRCTRNDQSSHLWRQLNCPREMREQELQR